MNNLTKIILSLSLCGSCAAQGSSITINKPSSSEQSSSSTPIEQSIPSSPKIKMSKVSVSISSISPQELTRGKAVDISNVDKEVQRYLMLRSSVRLVQMSKDIVGSESSIDILATMKRMYILANKISSSKLPADYQAYIQEENKIIEDAIKDLEVAMKALEPDDQEGIAGVMMMSMFKYAPRSEANKKKHPEPDRIIKGLSGPMSIYKTFELEERVDAFKKKVRDSGESDEMVIESRCMKVAAKALRAKAKNL